MNVFDKEPRPTVKAAGLSPLEALRIAFPGIWVRGDGAIQHVRVEWAPGIEPEQSAVDPNAVESTPRSQHPPGVIYVTAVDYGRAKGFITMAQHRALLASIDHVMETWTA